MISRDINLKCPRVYFRRSLWSCYWCSSLLYPFSWLLMFMLAWCPAWAWSLLGAFIVHSSRLSTQGQAGVTIIISGSCEQTSHSMLDTFDSLIDPYIHWTNIQQTSNICNRSATRLVRENLNVPIVDCISPVNRHKLPNVAKSHIYQSILIVFRLPDVTTSSVGLLISVSFLDDIIRLMAALYLHQLQKIEKKRVSS